MPEFQLNPLSVEPENIRISKSKGIDIEWRDGHRSHYDLQFLRDHCPCATCTGAHGTPPPAANPLALYKPALKIDGVEEIGSYAIQLNWNDGHNAGIYSFHHFRMICPCEDCRRVCPQ